MLQDLFINATILVAFISLGNQFIFGARDIRSSPLFCILLGVFSGMLGCILMLYSVTVTPSIILDLRNIAIIIASILGGFTSSIIASVIMGIFRILHFGVATSSIVALIIVLLMGVGCPIITGKIKSLYPKWIYATLFSTIIVSMPFLFFIQNIPLLIELLTAYWIANLIVVFILFFYIKRLVYVNNLYHKYKTASSTDYLTGLNNVRQFDTVYNEISSKSIEKKEYLSLLFIDIDFFKSVNDTYGHTEGDVVLKELGNLLLRTCRSFDVVSRNGGEEFSVMLIDSPPPQAMSMAEQIRSAVEKHAFTLSNQTAITITVSIGVATYPDTTEDVSKLIEYADSALYKAKQAGRNRVIFQEDKNCFVNQEFVCNSLSQSEA
jgi:diguanylate cyclase